MYTTEAVGKICVASGHHQTNDPAYNAWIVETENRLTDKQATALKNMQSVIHGVENIKMIDHRRFQVTLEADADAAVEAEILKLLIERFMKYLERESNLTTVPLAVHSEVGPYDGR